MPTTLPRDDAAVALRSRIDGSVIAPTDDAYDELRRVWNRSFEHRPALIVIPTSSKDVSEALAHARTSGWSVVVQATGHGFATTSETALLLLMHEMRDVSIDVEARTARIGGGATWGAVLEQTTPHGLAPLLGSTPEVGAVGYTLGGGIGWLARAFGAAVDRVRSFEVVTADGVILRVSPQANPDLFWALRGGGAGNLGVVTEMEIDLVDVPSLYAGNLLYPSDAAKEVASRYREWIADAPDALTSSICFMNFPPIDDVPEPIRGRSFVIVRGAFIGSDEDGESLLAFWRSWRAPELDLWGRIPFSEVATISNDPVDPLAGVTATEWLDEISTAAVGAIVDAVFGGDGPSPIVFAEIRHVGGAVGAQPAHPAAYGHRDREYLLEVVGIVPDEAVRGIVVEAIGDLRGALAGHATGEVYLNFLEGPEKASAAARAFDAPTRERLRAVKSTVDPTNLFRNGVDLT